MIHKTTHFHLNQLKALVHQLSNEQFQSPLPILESGTIGKHVRHILEFYICLCDSIENGELNYDNRQRDQQMEVNVQACIKAIGRIEMELNRYPDDFPIKLTADHSMNTLKKEISIFTTFYRELLYNIEHIVHHLAIIRIGIKSLEAPIFLDESIGVAVSTIRNRKQCVQ